MLASLVLSSCVWGTPSGIPMPLPQDLDLVGWWEDGLTVVDTLCPPFGVCGRVLHSSDIGLLLKKAIKRGSFFRCLPPLTSTGIQVLWLSHVFSGKSLAVCIRLSLNLHCCLQPPGCWGCSTRLPCLPVSSLNFHHAFLKKGLIFFSSPQRGKLSQSRQEVMQPGVKPGFV